MSPAVELCGDVAQGEPSRGRRLGVALVALAAACSIPGVAGAHLTWPDEPRVAGIAAEMQDAGLGAIPTLGGRPFLEHPPLVYWEMALAFRAFGRGEVTARLPSLAAGLASAALLGLLVARATNDARRGAFAGGALLVTAEHVRLSHHAMVDAPLEAAVVACMYCVRRGLEPGAGRAAWFPLAGVAAALAFYTKGAIGLALPTCALVGLLAVRRDLSVLRSPWPWCAPLVCALVVLPWVLALHAADGWTSLEVVFVDNGWRRLFPTAEGYSGGHRDEPWHFYLRVLPAALLPLTVALPAALRSIAGARTDAARELLGLLAGWLGLGLLLLSLAGTKRENYLLPILPPAVAIVGAWLGGLRDERRDEPGGADRPSRDPLEALTLRLLALAAPVAPLVPVGVALAFGGPPGPWIWASSAAALVPAALAVRAYRRGRLAAFATAVGVTVTLVTCGGMAADNGSGRERQLADFTREVGRRVPRDAALLVLEPVEAMIGSASFYAGRRLEPVADLAEARAALRGPRPTYLIVIERRGRPPEPVGRSTLVADGATPVLEERREGDTFVATLLANAAAAEQEAR